MPTGTYPRRPIAERFMEKVLPVPESGCWLWDGCRQEPGYGRVKFNGKTEHAHRVSHILFKGQLNGLDVCHTCDVPACVNPAHLFLGTASDNAKDMVRKGRSYVVAEKAKTHCKRGHLLAGVNLYINRTTGTRQCKACRRIVRRQR